MFLLVVVGVQARLYRVNATILGPHAVRRADTAAVARNFYEGSMNILYPQVDWRGNSAGYVESEFPIYTYLVALLYQAFGPYEGLGRVLNIAVYTLSAFLLFRFVRRLFNDRIALLAVYFYSVVPLSLVYTSGFQPDALMALGSLAGIYFFWIWTEENRWTALALSALGIALAILIKPTSLYLGIPLLYLCWRKFGWQLLRKPVLWLFAAVVILPAFLWYSHAYSLWLNYGNTYGVFAGWVKVGIPSLADRLWLSLGKRLLLRLLFLIATPAGVLLLLVGFFTKPPRQNYVLYWWAIGFGISILVAFPGHWVHDYYQLPIVFVTAAWMAHGAVLLWGNKRLPQKLSRVFVAALCLFVAGFGLQQFQATLRLPQSARDRLAFGKTVNSLTEPDALVIFALPLPPFWHPPYGHRTANGEYLGSDPVDFYLSHRKGWSIDESHASPEFVETLRQRGAKYFATFAPGILERRPDLKVELGRSHTPVEVTPRWAIYRLETPTRWGENTSRGRHVE